MKLVFMTSRAPEVSGEVGVHGEDFRKRRNSPFDIGVRAKGRKLPNMVDEVSVWAMFSRNSALGGI